MSIFYYHCTTTLSIMLYHGISGPENDDSVHADKLATTPTPQTSSTAC